MSRFQRIIKWYYEQDFDDAAISFDDYLADAVATSLGKTRIEAEFYAADNSDRIWEELKKFIVLEKGRGLYPTFAVVAPGLKRLFWYPNYFPPDISKHDRYKRLRTRSRNHIMKCIQGLNSRQYEALCILTTKLSGASQYCFTPQSNEFGIDFFGVIPSVGKSHLFNGGSGPIRIVGQSKKQSSNVSRNRLQQFVSTLQSIYERSELVRGLIPSWFIKQRGPIVGWFVAHKGLESGARDYANNYGIIHSDSRDLAEIITMSRAWQPSDGLLAPVELMSNEIDALLT